jgi:hypothetical protein
MNRAAKTDWVCPKVPLKVGEKTFVEISGQPRSQTMCCVPRGFFKVGEKNTAAKYDDNSAAKSIVTYVHILTSCVKVGEKVVGEISQQSCSQNIFSFCPKAPLKDSKKQSVKSANNYATKRLQANR